MKILFYKRPKEITVSVNYGLLPGLLACYFGLLCLPGSHENYNHLEVDRI